MINITINGEKLRVAEGTTIFTAAKQANFDIPHLCYHENLSHDGACGLCVVEIQGEKNLTRSCVRPVQEGMIITTNSPRIRNTRKMLIELLLSNHPYDCFTCEKNDKCELKALATRAGVNDIRFETRIPGNEVDDSSFSIIRYPDKCVLCGRCVSVCNDVQTVGALSFSNRGEELVVTTGLKRGLADTECVNCGQCIQVCPVAAISEKSSTKEVWKAIEDPAQYVVVQEAPAVRVALGEDLGLPPGTLVTGKMRAALKKLGFDSVFDTNFTADLTIMEEGSELVKRVTGGGVLPMFTSCCPAWVKFLEHFYPDLIPHLSTCKSPQQMFGALAKTYFAEKIHLDPAKIVSVSVMPCTAKKFEAQRPEMSGSGYRDVDYVLTTREIARMIRAADIDFKNLPDAPPDDLMGLYSGAATIFGVTGGVMEAALRSAYYLITGTELKSIDIEPVRGMDGVREATVDIKGQQIKVAVAHGLGNARKLVEEVRAGKSPYQFIEVMACPGGCVGGGGQPYGFDLALRSRRGDSLYKEDKSLPVRKSHENPAIKKLYKEFLTEPLGKKSHHLLHTGYIDRTKIPGMNEVLQNCSPG